MFTIRIKWPRESGAKSRRFFVKTSLIYSTHHLKLFLLRSDFLHKTITPNRSTPEGKRAEYGSRYRVRDSRNLYKEILEKSVRSSNL